MAVLSTKTVGLGENNATPPKNKQCTLKSSPPFFLIQALSCLIAVSAPPIPAPALGLRGGSRF